MLDPFVGILSQACQINAGVLTKGRKQGKGGKKISKKKDKKFTQSTQVVSLVVSIVAFLLRAPLPSVPIHISALTESILGLLQTATPELLRNSFKALSVIIRNCEFYTVSDSYLKIVLSFVEQDILKGSDRQTLAFNLLRAIIFRKFVVPKVYHLMTKISEMMVQSYHANVRPSPLSSHPLKTL